VILIAKDRNRRSTVGNETSSRGLALVNFRSTERRDLSGAISPAYPSFNPIQALFWSAVINGVVAAPVMVMMMLLTANTKVMGQFTVTGILRFTGWLATAVMAAAVVGMLLLSCSQGRRRPPALALPHNSYLRR
jgi:Natural resistance-associated macrophage protein